MAYLLAERNWWIENSLLAFPNAFCKKNWLAFLKAELQIMVFKYFFLQGFSSMLSDSISLVDDFLFCWHRRHCSKLPLSCTFYYCQPQIQILGLFHLLTLFKKCFTQAVIHRKHHISSIALVVWICRLICLQDVILGTVQKTWLLASNFNCFWCICYFTKLCYWGRNS